MGSDRANRFAAAGLKKFQSTLPVWGATSDGQEKEQPEDISIHAPRMGSDTASAKGGHVIIKFQSTLPVWGAT